MDTFREWKALILLLTLLGMILCSCSSNINKIYDYEKTHQVFEGGEVQVNLSGTFNSSNNETIKRNPYNLLIVFELEPYVDGVLLSTGFELINSVTKKEILKKAIIPKKPFKKDLDGKYRVYLSEKGLKLDYANYKLNLKFVIKNGDLLINEKLNFEFKKAYKEYKSNTFWDRLMSV